MLGKALDSFLGENVCFADAIATPGKVGLHDLDVFQLLWRHFVGIGRENNQICKLPNFQAPKLLLSKQLPSRTSCVSFNSFINIDAVLWTKHHLTVVSLRACNGSLHVGERLWRPRNERAILVNG